MYPTWYYSNTGGGPNLSQQTTVLNSAEVASVGSATHYYVSVEDGNGQLTDQAL